MKRVVLRRVIVALSMSGVLTLSSQALGAAFQLFEQDGASPGVYHAGYAAIANDASTAFYNPAGMTRIQNQQVVFAALAVTTSIKYQGFIQVLTLNGNDPSTVTSQAGTFSLIPALHYVAPINEWIAFGLSVDVPFGAKSDYGNSTDLRYAATRTTVKVIDLSPSLAFQLTKEASIGFGFDVQKMYAEFYSVGVLGLDTGSLSTNKFNDTAYGYHLGALYQFNENTRAGISYHSKVLHHLSGTSYFEGPIPQMLNGGPLSSHASTKLTLPAYTALSVYSRVRPKIAVMGSLIYTQWNVFKTLVLNSISGVQGMKISKSIQLYVPEFYKNTFNFSVGTEYYASDKVTYRAGIGYDQSPANDAYRNVELPDNDRFVIALGGHYQAAKQVGLDFSWLHVFIKQANINPPPQVMGDQIVTTIGRSTGGADVFAAQVTWDIV